MSSTLTIGTRGSALALWQAHHVKDRLEKRFPALRVEVLVIKTTGDRILNQALSAIGDKGLFTREIEEALLDGRVDIAVHSLKDLPTETPEGLRIGAVTKREDVRDVLISRQWRSIADLPEGALIATGSLRRTSQLLHLRPDVRVVDIRGNLNTRFAKFDASKWDGMLLACAGVKRLGWADRIAQIIPPELILPAVGQGALGIEIREGDEAALRAVRVLHHDATFAATTAERALLRTLEGGCQIPIGAWARVKDGRLLLDATVGSIDGTIRLDAGGSVAEPAKAAQLGRRIAKKLYDNGAKAILDDIRAAAPKRA
ncbi:MAG: hydroxymethylbilane synthase [Ignavibacteria bacterium]|nr:hydroxymethylbilane synthase [Ignavibacteria bacterium]